MSPKIVNFDLITLGQSEEDAKSNAKYAISVARKIGASIFLLPEDIFTVQPKMLLTFIGTIMAIHLSKISNQEDSGDHGDYELSESQDCAEQQEDESEGDQEEKDHN